jgi:hypothetical protein
MDVPLSSLGSDAARRSIILSDTRWKDKDGPATAPAPGLTRRHGAYTMEHLLKPSIVVKVRWLQPENYPRIQC